ncbi:nuclear factor 7, brain-like [Thalassophryne amazonica]|uniref:nuclear factor 7, brain-like n=1 Tax=Thalassophryne amazonica TaxID=390379 RepID=UPI001471D179|nr:nuclear factor 7, brain-like [Thalassophryne amazonica]
MASVSYSEDLTCSVCLTIFTDPVMLLCGHSFCRECITESLKSQGICPLCHTAVSLEQKCLPPSYVLKSLAEKAKEDEKRKREHGNYREDSEWLCHEHDEKLKLFCVTEQTLTCVICRDGEKHAGHKFKPIKEASASVRQELEKLMQRVSDDVCTVENLADSQREEITKTKRKSNQLRNQISTQFEEMHQFLRKREREIINELKHKEDEDVKKVIERLIDIQAVLSEDEMLKRKVTSALEIKESERFLKTCADEKIIMTAEHFKPRSKNLKVMSSALNLGPFESHLQFFVWKEMLQIIKPREENLKLVGHRQNVTVSDDGRSLFSSSRTTSTSQFYEK